MNEHQLIKTIEQTDDPRDVFSLVVELAYSRLRDVLLDQQQYVERGSDHEWSDHDAPTNVDPRDSDGLVLWFTNGGLAIVGDVLREFDINTWTDVIDGEYQDRGLEAVSGYDDLRTEIRMDAEIAVRNEVELRLMDRNIVDISRKPYREFGRERLEYHVQELSEMEEVPEETIETLKKIHNE